MPHCTSMFVAPRPTLSGSLTLVRWLAVLATSAAVLHGGSILATATTPTYPTPGTGSTSLSFPQFDPSNGTLTSITFTLTGVSSVTVTVNNTTSTNATDTFSDDPAIILPGLQPVRSFGLSVYEPVSGSFVAPPGPFTYTTPTQTKTNSLTTNDPPFLSGFIGSGTASLAIFLNESGPDGFGNGPTYFVPAGPVSLTANWAARLDVTYTFAPVPEPSTLGMLAIGTVALFGLAWRSKQRGSRQG
jgi:PEP-CTERM motif